MFPVVIAETCGMVNSHHLQGQSLRLNENFHNSINGYWEDHGPKKITLCTPVNGKNLSLYSSLSFLLLFWQENYCDTVQRTFAGFLSKSEPQLYGWNIVDTAQNTKQSIMDVESSLLFKNLLENDVEREILSIHDLTHHFLCPFPRYFLCVYGVSKQMKLVLDWIWRSRNCLRLKSKFVYRLKYWKHTGF